MVFANINGLPFAAGDAIADLGGSFSLTGLLVGVEILPDADLATGAVFAGEAVQETGVPLTAIAVAIARLLIEDVFDTAGRSVSVLD